MKLFKQNLQTLTSPVRCQSPEILSQKIKSFTPMPTLQTPAHNCSKCKAAKACSRQAGKPEAT